MCWSPPLRQRHHPKGPQRETSHTSAVPPPSITTLTWRRRRLSSASQRCRHCQGKQRSPPSGNVQPLRDTNSEGGGRCHCIQSNGRIRCPPGCGPAPHGGTRPQRRTGEKGSLPLCCPGTAGMGWDGVQFVPQTASTGTARPPFIVPPPLADLRPVRATTTVLGGPSLSIVLALFVAGVGMPRRRPLHLYLSAGVCRRPCRTKRRSFSWITGYLLNLSFCLNKTDESSCESPYCFWRPFLR